MELIIGLGLLALVIVIALVAFFKLRRGNETQPWPVFVKKPLTQIEQALYLRLVKALPEHIVLAQVKLSSILGVKQDVNLNHWNNRIDRMGVDFLVCLKDATVVAAIELEERGKSGSTEFVGDENRDKALMSAGVALVRWRVDELPDEVEIRKAFEKPIATAPLTILLSTRRAPSNDRR